LNFFKNNIAVVYNQYFNGLWKSPLTKNISKVYVGDVLSKLFFVGTTLLLIRGLTVEDYANFTVFYGMLIFVPSLVGGGITSGLVRFSTEYISKTKSKPFQLYFIGLIFQLVIYIFLCLAFFSSANRVTSFLFGQKHFDLALRYALIGGLGFLVTQAGRGIYQAEERFDRYIKTLLFRQCLTFFFLSFLFLVKKAGFHQVAQVVIGVELFVASVIIFDIFRGLNFHRLIPAFEEDLYMIKKFIFSAGWLIGYYFMLSSFQRLDIFMLSHFSSTEELANYGVAYRYYSAGLLLLGSIHAVLLPKFSKVDIQVPELQRKFACRWLRVTGWLAIPIGLCDIFGKPLFIQVNGAGYENSFYIFIVFSFGIWLSLMFSPLVNILMSRKAFKFLFALATGALVLNFTGNYLLIPLWGGLGAALITILSFALINVISGVRIFLSKR